MVGGPSVERECCYPMHRGRASSPWLPSLLRVRIKEREYRSRSLPECTALSACLCVCVLVEWSISERPSVSVGLDISLWCDGTQVRLGLFRIKRLSLARRWMLASSNRAIYAGMHALVCVLHIFDVYGNYRSCDSGDFPSVPQRKSVVVLSARH